MCLQSPYSKTKANAAAAACVLAACLQESQAQRRAYLSNICVALGARRQGVAAALMAEAEQAAAGLGEELCSVGCTAAAGSTTVKQLLCTVRQLLLLHFTGCADQSPCGSSRVVA